MSINIEIQNCNNIDSGVLSLEENKLNIKYGINGTGKSTIAKAIKNHNLEEKLNLLTPFKSNPDNPLIPSVNISCEIHNTHIFNEEYINQFVYKEDELISNSFEVFIKTSNYIESSKKIDTILENVTKIFIETEELTNIIRDFESLLNSFKTTKTTISKSSTGYKALKDGNKLENIPDELKSYTPFLKNESCTSWLDWQMKGEKFLEIAEDCPFCTSPTTSKKETIKSISKTYNKTTIKNLTAILEAIDNLGDYFSSKCKATLQSITKKHNGLEDSEIDYIYSTTQQIQNLLNKLKALKEISYHSLKNDEKINEKIESYKIFIEPYDRFESEKTSETLKSLNESLDEILKQIGLLQGEINKQKQATKRLIENHQISINEFLKKAGYKYQVSIEEVDRDYKLKLQHIDSKNNITKGDQHLSFGEKNAFALVLFMYESLSKNPDLIILDDPISSFDKNKKYAIMDMLFREDSSKSLKGSNVLMLTHDIEPIIDTIKVLGHKFGNTTNAHFLSTINGNLQEIKITKNDLQSFTQICTEIVQDDDINDIIKLIYLRRYYESIDDKTNEYQVLSNLIHKRQKDEATDQRVAQIDGESQKLSENNFDDGVEKIKSKFLSFNYEALLETLKQNDNLIEIYNNTEDGFAKIILFRILIEDIPEAKKLDNIFMKFINEVYHIENELLFQLNPNKYNVAPQFIINECDNFIQNLSDNHDTN